MIIYEVRIRVEPHIAEAYRTWLDGHIHQILTLPGFERAELLQEELEQECPVYTVRYHLDNRQSLAVYLRDHASRLRAEGIAQFGDQFTATRRVMELVRIFS
jgi:heme-degrading monooxygenase HmoA